MRPVRARCVKETAFDPNGGTGTMQPMKVKSGEEFELPECTFTPPEGKEFAGWLAANGTVYPAGDIVFSTTDSVLKACLLYTSSATSLSFHVALRLWS